MFRLYSQLPRGPHEIRAHVDALSKMTTAKGHQELFNHLYSCLSILDTKSSSLLSFNSIIIAVFAIVMTGQLGGMESIVAGAGMAAILLSALLLLSVVWVHWSTTEDLADLEDHAIVLLEVRKTRTVRYRIAWYFSVFSIVTLMILLVLRFVLRSP